MMLGRTFTLDDHIVPYVLTKVVTILVDIRKSRR
jgi:hypothetical protein